MKSMQTNFIKSPNLPNGDVALVAISSTYSDVINSLNNLNIETFLIQPNQVLSKPVCCHADMTCHHLGDNKIVVAKGEIELQNELKNYGFDVIEAGAYLNSSYPDEVLFNAARIEKILFAGKTVDHKITEYCKNNEIKVGTVNQGYSKCSTAILDSHSIITSDKSIAIAAMNAGIDVLEIVPGYISLEGCNYGFIGGCCGKIGRDRIAFTGSLKKHPDEKRIRTFINKKNIEIIELTNHNLIDIGGILPLKEYV